MTNIYTGVPSKNALELACFEDALLNRGSTSVQMNLLTMNKDRQMTRVQFHKIALNDVSLKCHVENDGINCTPFKINNQYI